MLGREAVHVPSNGCTFFYPAENSRDESAEHVGDDSASLLPSLPLELGGGSSNVPDLGRRWRGAPGSFYVSSTPKWSHQCHSDGMQPSLQSVYAIRSYFTMSQMQPADERYNEIPPEYGAALPLDVSGPLSRNIPGSFGYPSVVYKVVDRRSGLPYAIRRVDGARASYKAARAAQTRWNTIRHARIIPLQRAFILAGAVYFVHDFVPCAKSLLERYFMPSMVYSGTSIPESALWSVLVQVIAAIRVVHGASAAFRSIGLSRILVTVDNRVFLGSVGVNDVLDIEKRKELNDRQSEDMMDLGRVLFALATGSVTDAAPPGSRVWMQQMQYLETKYSCNLICIMTQLIIRPPTAFALCDALASHAFDELSWASVLAHSLDGGLAAEVGARKVFHVLLHLSVIALKRPFSSLNTCTMLGHWQLLVLFCPYVLNQVDQHGKVVVDYGHVIPVPHMHQVQLR